ncbi:MAG: serine/threonine protein kinase [Bdellovibrionales bacterium]|nr:serine/threonine protein kinase [Bdellovibrionales bacterium]
MEEQQLLENTRFAERYKILRRIGKGGMGEVYLAQDTILNNETVALKVLLKKITSSEKHTQRFLREVQLTRQVTHENIVRTFDVGVSNGALFFTMEFVEGESLSEIIRRGPMSWLDAGDLLLQLCSGLEAIHEREIVHRDLKPGNIIVTKDGVAKITDFGVARPSVSELTTHDEVIGSAHYMAPEVWVGKDISFAADIYALGVVAYELLTGCVPFDADSPAELMWKHLEEKPVPPVELNQSIPDWLNQLVLALLEKDHAKRPYLAGEVKNFIRRSLNGTAITGELHVLAPEVVAETVAHTTEMEVSPDPYVSQFDLEAPLANGSLLESATEENESILQGGSQEIDGHIFRVGRALSTPVLHSYQPLSIFQALSSGVLFGALFALLMAGGLEFFWRKALLFANPIVALAVLVGVVITLSLFFALPVFVLARTFFSAASSVSLWKKASGLLFCCIATMSLYQMSEVSSGERFLARTNLKREMLVPLGVAAEYGQALGLLAGAFPSYSVVETSGQKALVRAESPRQNFHLPGTASFFFYLFALIVLFVSELKMQLGGISKKQVLTVFCGFFVPGTISFFASLLFEVGSVPDFTLPFGPISFSVSPTQVVMASAVWLTAFTAIFLARRFRDESVQKQ